MVVSLLRRCGRSCAVRLCASKTSQLLLWLLLRKSVLCHPSCVLPHLRPGRGCAFILYEALQYGQVCILSILLGSIYLETKTFLPILHEWHNREGKVDWSALESLTQGSTSRPGSSGGGGSAPQSASSVVVSNSVQEEEFWMQRSFIMHCIIYYATSITILGYHLFLLVLSTSSTTPAAYSRWNQALTQWSAALPQALNQRWGSAFGSKNVNFSRLLCAAVK